MRKLVGHALLRTAPFFAAQFLLFGFLLMSGSSHFDTFFYLGAFIVLSNLLVPSYLSSSGIYQFIKLNSRSNKAMWKQILKYHCVLVLTTMAIAIAVGYLRTNATPAEKFDFIFSFEVVWIFLSALVWGLGCITTQNHVRVLLTPSKTFTRSLAGVIGLFVVMIAFLSSRLFGFVLTTILLWLFLTLFSAPMIDSWPLKIRKKSLYQGFVCIASLAAISFAFEISKSQPSSFLGVLDYRNSNSHNSSNLADIVTVDDWYNWYKQVSKTATASELAVGFKKLEIICPPLPSDEPASIRCYADGDVRCRTLSLPEQNSVEIIKLIKSDSVYAQLAGLLLARQLTQPPAELSEAIRSLATQPGNLSPVALVTLSQKRPDSQSSICLKTLSSKK